MRYIVKISEMFEFGYLGKATSKPITTKGRRSEDR